MSIISTAICRSFFLWLHLGIGPMIGAGPMQARPGRPKSVRTRGAGNAATGKSPPHALSVRGSPGARTVMPKIDIA